MINLPRVMRVAATLALISSGLLVPKGFAFQEPATGVIHALLVADTDSSLGDSVKADVERLSAALTSAFLDQPSRLRLDSPLTGSSVTVSAIESFFNDVKSGPDDTLLFYFSGHGEVRSELGHVLNFTNPDKNGRKVLPRFSLLSLMKAKRPRLVVVMTDCCSAIRRSSPVAPAAQAPGLEVPPPRWAVAGCLFLQHRGVVDITASCPGQAAWPDSSGVGGIFTESFVGLLERYSWHFLDINKDGFVDWNEFYPALEKRAQQSFANLQYSLKDKKQRLIRNGADPDDALSEDENQAILQTTQKSWTFSILPFLRVGVRVLDGPLGLKLEEIYPGTPASEAPGLKRGDIIVGIGEQPVRNESEFLRAVDATSGDKPLVLKVKEPGAAGPRTITINLRDNDIPANVQRLLTPIFPATAPAPQP
jgi:hypothetical protein